MQGALTGFVTIWVVIAAGWGLAALGGVTSAGQRFMANLAFVLASPLLLFSLMSTSSLDRVFSPTVAASALAILATAAVYLVLWAAWFRTGAGGAVIGSMLSSYTNAANLGLPVAAHVLGDMTWMAPILLIQVAVLQPVCLAVLDVRAARRAGRALSPWRYVAMPFKNPITVGILAGLAVRLLGVEVPSLLMTPISMVGGMAVPLMLLSFGASLRLDPRPGKGPHVVELWVIQAIKILLHPLIAFTIGWLAFGLGRYDLLAVTVIAALPAAQNVFVIATRYGVQEALARDGVFWSTFLSMGSIFVIAALLA